MIICFGAVFVLLLIAFILLKSWIQGEEGLRNSQRKIWIKSLDGFSLNQLEFELEQLKNDAERTGLYPGIPEKDRTSQIERVREDKKRIKMLETIISERKQA